MTYPSYPVSTAVYAALSTFDASHMADARIALYGSLSLNTGPLPAMMNSPQLGQSAELAMLNSSVKHGGGQARRSSFFASPVCIGPRRGWIVIQPGGDVLPSGGGGLLSLEVLGQELAHIDINEIAPPVDDEPPTDPELALLPDALELGDDEVL